jgi:hypothetical protein
MGKLKFMSRFSQQGNMDHTCGPKLGPRLKASGAENVGILAMSLGVGQQGTTADVAKKSSWNMLT